LTRVATGVRCWFSALLVALATAVLAAVAGARRGQPGFDWAKVRTLPEVSALSMFPVTWGFAVEGDSGASAGIQADSEFTRTIERPVVLEGRLFNPGRVDEVLVTPKFVASYGKSVGDILTCIYQARNRPTWGTTDPRTTAQARRSGPASSG
jgi:hypothetical protein